PTERVAKHGTVPPVRADEGGLPDVFDAQRILAQQERPEVLIDGRFDRAGTLREGGTPKAIETWFAGHYLDHDEADASGSGEDGLYVGDLESRKLAGLG